MIVEIANELQLQREWQRLRNEGLEPILTIGDSMLPLLEPNHLIGLPTSDKFDHIDVVVANLTVGSLWAFNNPDDGRIIIKKVEAYVDTYHGVDVYMVGINQAVSRNYVLHLEPSTIKTYNLRPVQKYPYLRISDSLVNQIKQEQGAN